LRYHENQGWLIGISRYAEDNGIERLSDLFESMDYGEREYKRARRAVKKWHYINWMELDWELTRNNLRERLANG
jgi:hypothetical protein